MVVYLTTQNIPMKVNGHVHIVILISVTAEDVKHQGLKFT